MNVLREVEKVITLQNPQQKLDAIIGPLEQLFERGRALQLPPERVGRAASLLLAAAIEEQQAEIKEEIFAVLLTAVSWNEISRYIDWIALVDHLPLLSGYCLGYALGMLGRSRRYVFLTMLQDYLADPDLFVQIEALEAMKQLWWDTSGRHPELKRWMCNATLVELQSLYMHPYRHTTPKKELREHFVRICEEVVGNMKDWFKKYKHYEF